jgi:hypothetical protein
MAPILSLKTYTFFFPFFFFFFFPSLWISPLPKRVCQVLHYVKKNKNKNVHFNPHIERERKRWVSWVKKDRLKLSLPCAKYMDSHQISFFFLWLALLVDPKVFKRVKTLNECWVTHTIIKKKSGRFDFGLLKTRVKLAQEGLKV